MACLNIRQSTMPSTVPAFYSKTDDSASALIHHHQYPIRSQTNRFALKQVDAPQTVLHISNEREPGWTAFRRHRVGMLGQNASDSILINTGPKRQIDLVRNMWTSPGRITLLHLNNRTDQFACRTFRTQFIFLFW